MQIDLRVIIRPIMQYSYESYTTQMNEKSIR